MCTTVPINTFVQFFLVTQGKSQRCTCKVKNWTAEGNISRNVYNMYNMSSAVSIIFLIFAPFCSHTLALLSSSALSLQCYSAGEVMMRNGVIMLVVKPQAAQQMCFRDPLLSLNGLGLCSGNPIFNLTPVSTGNSVFVSVTNILSFSPSCVFNHGCT